MLINSRVREALALLLVVVSVYWIPAQAQQQNSYRTVIAFGDSLSDTGNLASIAFNFPFPYFRNRISDGPVALDYLVESIGLRAVASESGGSNYAVSGGNIVGSDREDLSAQIDDYLVRSAGAPIAGETLVFVMMGGNDLRDIRSIQSVSTAHARIDVAVATLMAQLQRLVGRGADNFFIVNVANVGRIPETLNRQIADPGVAARATRYVQRYNQLLADALARFAQPAGREVRLFDLYGEFERILDAPASFGFSQSTVGCFDVGSFSFHPDCLFGTAFDRFVFFDNLHPSGATHRLIGNAMITRLRQPDRSASQAALIGILQLLLLGDAVKTND